MSTNQGKTVRRYVLSVSPDALRDDPELLTLLKTSGVDEVAITGYLYGHWSYTPEVTSHWMQEAHKVGLKTSIVNVPLGHPGGALYEESSDTDSKLWKNYTNELGVRMSGTSIHPPATEENVNAIIRLRPFNPTVLWLDDDFRLARSPGVIGGCFCPDHKRIFLQKHGYGEKQWNELLDAIKARRLCPVLKNWIEMQCDLLTDCFHTLQKAAGSIPVGNMIMNMGCEKAGIRLKDYANSPFRVGEEHFDDRSFGSVKAKTEELFSVLFHRRFAKPHLAYSETTAAPEDQLSAANMAAKLCISTIADVRNTMYMSGLTAFPRTHWQTLAPAMKKQSEIHAKIAGAKPQGPLKHIFGIGSRYVGDDNPYTLFLAMGIPFEVCDGVPKGGWAFLGNSDLPQSKEIGSKGSTLICRVGAAVPSGSRTVEESLSELMALKHEIVVKMGLVPYVLQDIPVVCAWYKEIHKVLLWNLTEERQYLTLVYGSTRLNATVDALGTALLENV